MSDRQFELVPLDCPSCGAIVAASGVDVVFYCTACRNGYRFVEEKRLLEPVEVVFVAASHVPAERYLPFWQISARVAITQRQAGGRRQRSLMSALLDGVGIRGSQRPSAPESETRFAIPAFDATLSAVVELVRRYTRELPGLGEKLGERLLGGCYGVEDAKKLAHFALIAAEVERPDTLLELDYSLSFGEARLLGVPFVRHGDRWRDSLFAITI